MVTKWGKSTDCEQNLISSEKYFATTQIKDVIRFFMRSFHPCSCRQCYIVHPRYITGIFVQISHKRRPIAHPWGRGMGDLGVQSLSNLLILSRHSWWSHQTETFSALLAICVWGIHRFPVNSPHKGQWRRALMFSLICVWINSWVNNCEAGDLRCNHAHYDIIVMVVLHVIPCYIETRHISSL